MKPIRLTLAGLQSYREEQSIDFSKMQDCGLFGIFGPTGSGKSTILDGMTLALFGAVSRASHNTQGIINSACDQVAVSLTFELHIQGERQFYRIDRTYRRKRQAPESCEPRISKLIRLAEPEADSGTVLADKPTEVNQAVENLLGLHYDDFTRAVVLPQNQFQEFLLMAKKDKRDMLERLFCLEEYGQKLSQKIAVGRRLAEEAMSQAAGALGVLQDCTDEAVQEAKLNAQTLAGQRRQAVLAHESQKQAHAAGQLIYRLSRTREALLVRQAVLDGQSESILLDRQRLDAARRAEPIWPDLLECEDLDREISQLQQTFAARQTAADSLAQEMTVSAKLLAADQGQAESLRNDLEAQISRLASSINLISQKETLADRLAQTEQLQAEANALESAARKAAADLDRLVRLQQTCLQKFNLRRQTLNVDPDWRQTLERWLQAGEQQRVAVEERQAEMARSQLLADSLTRLAEQEQAASAFMTHEAADIFRTASARLQDGEACPLCGSGVHPHPAHLQEPPAHYQDDADYQALQKQLVLTGERLSASRLQLALLEEKNVAAANAVAALLAANPGLDQRTDPAGDLHKLYYQEKAQSELDQQIIRLAADNQQHLQTLQDESTRQAALAARIEGQRQLALELQGQMNQLDLALGASLPDWPAEQPSAAMILQRQADLEQQKITIEQNSRLLAARHRQLEEQHQSAEKQSIVLKTSLEMYKERQTKVMAHLAKAMADGGFADLAELAAARLEPAIIDALAEQLQRFDEERRDLQLQIRQCDDQLHGDLLDEAAWLLLDSRYQEAVQNLERAVRQADLADHKLSELLEREKIRQQKEADYRSAANRRDRISQIESLIRGNAFVEYVAEERLRAIVAEATEYLETMTRYRYALELDAEMSFVIRDQMNGGEVRAASSLSGGETFMASLALALALSSQIQIRGQSRLAFFFLDEGFGSLDSELLDLVMDSLERISSPLRMIGLISHVPELKNRIATRLLITSANSHQGSRIILERD